MRKLPVLRTLQTFEAVCSYPSFSAAAEAMGMTHGAISHQIRSLEAWLGRELFDRHKGGVSLNENGEHLRYACVRALDILEEELRTIKQPRNENAVSVGCSSTLLAHWLLPRMDGFFTAEPEVSVNFQTRSDVNSLVAGHIDLLIASEPALPVGGVEMTRLGVDKIGPVCAPGWRHMPSSPRDLAHLPLLHASSRLAAWKEWASVAGVDIEAAKGKTFDSLSLTIEAARAGLGFAMTPEFVVRSDLAGNRLVAPVGFVELERSTWICRRTADASSLSISALQSWLVDKAAEAELPSAGD